MFSVALEEALTLKLPSKSVTVPSLLPCTLTVAPMIGSPASSLTVPLTVWALIPRGIMQRRNSTANVFCNILKFHINKVLVN